MALPDWQIRRKCEELHRISCYHLAKAHIQRIQAKASFYYRQSVLSSPITYPTLAHHRKRTSKALRMLLAQILTYRTPIRCNAPTQWNWILWLESPSLANNYGFYRPKPIEAVFLMHLMHLTSNTQRSFSNKIN